MSWLMMSRIGFLCLRQVEKLRTMGYETDSVDAYIFDGWRAFQVTKPTSSPAHGHTGS